MAHVPPHGLTHRSGNVGRQVLSAESGERKLDLHGRARTRGLCSGVDTRLPEPIELAAYYTVAETLTNIARHASATVLDGEQADGPGSEEARDPSFTGTDSAPAETEQPDGQDAPDGEGEEQAGHAVADHCLAAAEPAALAVVTGTVAESDLDAENGFVV